MAKRVALIVENFGGCASCGPVSESIAHEQQQAHRHARWDRTERAHVRLSMKKVDARANIPQTH